MSNSDYYVRAYVEGDESSLLSLCNQYYGCYAGFVPRSLQHWLWCCKLHPDIGYEHIFVACKGKEIVGYVVLGKLAEKEGGFLIYELCYDRANDGQAIVFKLLKRIDQFTKDENGIFLRFDSPSDDPIVRKACEELGFKEDVLDEVLGYVVLNIVSLVKLILKSKADEWKGGNEAFLIRLRDASHPNDTIAVRWMDGELFVSNKMESDRLRVIIDTDLPTLSGLIFGGVSVLKAILKSKLAIRPFWKILKGTKLLSLLTLRDHWYIPRVDQL